MQRAGKESNFIKVAGSKPFLCSLCRRVFASKHNVFRHLNQNHGFSPIKRVKKRYLDDPTVEIPASTKARWKKRQAGLGFGDVGGSSLHHGDVSIHSEAETPHQEARDQQLVNDFSIASTSQANLHNLQLSETGLHTFSENTDSDASVVSNVSISDKDNEEKNVLPEQVVSSSNSSDSESEVNSSHDNDTTTSNDDFSDSSSCCEQDSLPEISGSAGPSQHVSSQDSRTLSMLSCFLRHNLSGSACKDIISTLKNIFPDSDGIQQMNCEEMWKLVSDCGGELKEYHYCSLCSEVFPDNRDLFNCQTPQCDGLRYKGADQTKIGRQPRHRFVFADIKTQLQLLLEAPGIWQDIQNRKSSIREGNGNYITDITDGTAYRKLLGPEEFLSQDNSITAVMNTDGVNLYSSLKVELWPIFLAINEMSPGARFARDNILLAAVWQGKGKPPFKQFLSMFSEEMNILKEKGVQITVNEEKYLVKLAVVCATLDLPAKASVLNMTFFNGSDACIACEEPGVVVQQGRGHSRCYKYRNPDEKHAARSCADVKVCMEQASGTDRVKGFRGPSGLMSLQGFDLVEGIVPDYMHGLLLGITKTLLCKWLSPTESTKPYFVGKSLREISKRLQRICPPDFIERLPRDLEKHYNHFKATELQTWILFYCVPCLSGILPVQHLDHVSKLSEATHILLGDYISLEAITRAEILLDHFYADFEDLYSAGSCGLNVHNAGSHLSDYVRKWGPMWAWSCFAFEDANALVLQSVHGTGDVVCQIARVKMAQAVIRKHGHDGKSKKTWKNLKEVSNCCIAGKEKRLTNSQLEKEVLEMMGSSLGVTDATQFSKVDRIVKDGHRLYSLQYSRMKRRECSIVLLDLNKYGQVLLFVLNNNHVYAVVQLFKTCATGYPELTAGKHLIPVCLSDDMVIVSAEELRETVVFIRCTDDRVAYVSRAPNKLGHAVFK